MVRAGPTCIVYVWSQYNMYCICLEPVQHVLYMFGAGTTCTVYVWSQYNMYSVNAFSFTFQSGYPLPSTFYATSLAWQDHSACYLCIIFQFYKTCTMYIFYRHVHFIKHVHIFQTFTHFQTCTFYKTCTYFLDIYIFYRRVHFINMYIL